MSELLPHTGHRAATLLLVLVALVSPALAAQDVLRVGRTLTGSLSSADTATYSLPADSGKFVLLEINQHSVDVVIRILDAEGTQRGRLDVTALGPERFSGETTRRGPYTVQVIPFEGASGDYSITLLRLEDIETDPKKLADQLMSPYDLDDSPGGLVHVWRNGRVLYSKSYGMANLAYGIPFETDTRTNIGSTSKQFTAFAIMLQADRGHLSLDDDVREHVPELPAFDEVITVRHLITHTSGLREFLNLVGMTGRRLDHGDWIDRSEIIDIVQRQPSLQNSPGAEFNYNNTAFGLAALIVERTSGQDFHVFMQENVFAPLGMTRTAVRPSPEHIIEDRSEGYTPGADGFRETGDLGGAVGAGGIYSTAADLQTWVENFASPRVGSDEIFSQMTTPFVLTNGEEGGYGFGLFIDEQNGLRRIHHGGADVAHRSMLAYYPEINAGITTQSNHASFDSNVAFRLAEAFFADEMEKDEPTDPSAVFDPADFDPTDFDDFVGRYALDAAPNFVLTFTREGESYYTQATGQQRLDIAPTSDSTFALSGVQASVVFHREADGSVNRITLNQNGQQAATRLDDDTAEEWAPTTEELIDFVGRYFSEELETFYTVALVDDHLEVRQRRLDDATLAPGGQDVFNGGGLELTFERDRNDQVIGFYASNVRTRDVRFQRVR
jgi:CubicO group peptidase (beta-lactamase class C family)